MWRSYRSAQGKVFLRLLSAENGCYSKSAAEKKPLVPFPVFLPMPVWLYPGVIECAHCIDISRWDFPSDLSAFQCCIRFVSADGNGVNLLFQVRLHSVVIYPGFCQIHLCQFVAFSSDIILISLQLKICIVYAVFEIPQIGVRFDCFFTPWREIYFVCRPVFLFKFQSRVLTKISGNTARQIIIQTFQLSFADLYLFLRGDTFPSLSVSSLWLMLPAWNLRRSRWKHFWAYAKSSFLFSRSMSFRLTASISFLIL